MVNSIGTDLLEKNRIERIFSRFNRKFINKVLTKKEISIFDSLKTSKKRIDFLSNNFAAKEAVSKVLGTGFSSGVTPKSIEIMRNDSGSPSVSLKNKANEVANLEGIEEVLLSISDTNEQSIAFALGVKRWELFC